MAYLLDTNILSEVKKGNRAAPMVRTWFQAIPDAETFISVMSIGEIRRGVERLRRTDSPAASSLEKWLNQVVATFATRTLPITSEVADLWGRLCPTQTLPHVDGLMAATALVHDLTIATRNTRDFERSGARMFNPFSAP